MNAMHALRMARRAAAGRSMVRDFGATVVSGGRKRNRLHVGAVKVPGVTTAAVRLAMLRLPTFRPEEIRGQDSTAHVSTFYGAPLK